MHAWALEKLQAGVLFTTIKVDEQLAITSRSVLPGALWQKLDSRCKQIEYRMDRQT